MIPCPHLSPQSLKGFTMLAGEPGKGAFELEVMKVLQTFLPLYKYVHDTFYHWTVTIYRFVTDPKWIWFYIII